MVSHTQKQEEWKAIENFPNYEVSTHGRVRSLKRTVITSNGQERQVGGRILAQGTTSRGYKNVCIRNEFGALTRNVHRLVMETFKPQDELPIINHKDEDPTNNHIDNLEWCTYSHNSTHNDVHIRRSKKVYQYDSEMNLLRVFRTAQEACEKFDGVTPQGISNCATGKLKTHAGYVWSYESNLEDLQNALSRVKGEVSDLLDRLNQYRAA